MRANRELRRLVNSRSAFVSAVSHELRNPLTAIGNAARVLRDAPGDADSARFLAMIDRNRRRLVDLVNDLLDLARIESGRFEVRPERLDLRELLTHIVEVFEGQAEERSISLEVRAAEALPLVLADPTRIEQVLSNLVSNALAATDADGEVVIAAQRLTSGVELSVEDTGTGIAADDHEPCSSPSIAPVATAARVRGWVWRSPATWCMRTEATYASSARSGREVGSHSSFPRTRRRASRPWLWSDRFAHCRPCPRSTSSWWRRPSRTNRGRAPRTRHVGARSSTGCVARSRTACAPPTTLSSCQVPGASSSPSPSQQEAVPGAFGASRGGAPVSSGITTTAAPRSHSTDRHATPRTVAPAIELVMAALHGGQP